MDIVFSHKKSSITSGTKEWASSNVNIYRGCSNNCKYCYAKLMAVRFKRKTLTNWKTMEVDKKALYRRYKLRNGRIMFPSSHDITDDPEVISNCIHVLRKMLSSGNTVLITTKPRLIAIKRICRELNGFKNQILFRFTITSINDELLQFWEECAPTFSERISALKHAYYKGFKTSISIEPFLDDTPLPVVNSVMDFVTDTIWVGKMNHIRKNGLTIKEKQQYKRIRNISSFQNIKKFLPELFETTDMIRLKDSIRNMILETH